MPLLLQIAAGKVAKEHHFADYPIFIGRLPECQVVIEDTRISRRHARIWLEAGVPVVEDLGSTNGVFVNGRRVQRRELGHGDVINAGGIREYLFLMQKDETIAAMILGRPAPLDDLSSTSPRPMRALDLTQPGPAPAPEAPAQERALTHLLALHELTGRLISTEGGTRRMLEVLVDGAIEMFSARRGFFLMKAPEDGGEDRWELHAARAAAVDDLEPSERQGFGRSLLERSLAEGRICTSAGIRAGRAGPVQVPAALRDVICGPAVSADGIEGGLYLDGCRLEDGFSTREAAAFDLVCLRIAEAVRARRLQKESKRLTRELDAAAKEREEMRRRLDELERRARAASGGPKTAAAAPRKEASRPAQRQESEGARSARALEVWDLDLGSIRGAPVTPGPADSTDEHTVPECGAGSADEAATSPPGAGSREGAQSLLDGLVAMSVSTRDLHARVREIARHFDVVLMTGPFGSGKKSLARALHDLSPRAGGPFVRFSCSALSGSEGERRLFGWVEASAGGEPLDRAGAIDRAGQGVLLLEDIERLPPAAQLRLERLLERRTFERVGSEEELLADLKLVVTTTRDLPSLVAAGEFRHDLYRLHISVVELKVPPLAERLHDIRALSAAWVAEFAARFRKPVQGLSAEAQLALETYNWPGNLVELRHALQSTVMAVTAARIELGDLPASIQESFAARRDDVASRILFELE